MKREEGAKKLKEMHGKERVGGKERAMQTEGWEKIGIKAKRRPRGSRGTGIETEMKGLKESWSLRETDYRKRRLGEGESRT